jgi:hypothetical protein
VDVKNWLYSLLSALFLAAGVAGADTVNADGYRLAANGYY